MRRLDVKIPVPDGHSAATLHLPDWTGPWPGVLVFPGKRQGGARETMREMADHVATMGYVALVPDIYYRAGEWEPFDMATLFTDDRERARLASLAGALTYDRIVADAASYADFLLSWPEVTGFAIGTTGYCLGGHLSLIAAVGLGDKVAAAASFHGGRLAVADDLRAPLAGGPHHSDRVRGRSHRRRFVHDRAGRVAGSRAYERRSRPHRRVLSRAPRICGARQPNLRR